MGVVFWGVVGIPLILSGFVYLEIWVFMHQRSRRRTWKQNDSVGVIGSLFDNDESKQSWQFAFDLKVSFPPLDIFLCSFFLTFLAQNHTPWKQKENHNTNTCFMMFQDLLMNLFRSSPPQTSNPYIFCAMTKTLQQQPKRCAHFLGFFWHLPPTSGPWTPTKNSWWFDGSEILRSPVDGRENPPCNLQRFKKHLKWLFGISCTEHR